MQNFTSWIGGGVTAMVTLTATNVNPIDPALKDIILTAIAALLSWGTQWLLKKLSNIKK